MRKDEEKAADEERNRNYEKLVLDLDSWLFTHIDGKRDIARAEELAVILIEQVTCKKIPPCIRRLTNGL